MKPPLKIGPINYIVGPNFAYLQSLSGAVTLTLYEGRSIPLGPQPLMVKQEQFPIFVNARKIEFFELILVENISVATEFFLNYVDSEYFYFKLPVLKTTKLTSSSWSEYWLDLQSYFETNPVIKVVSISSLVITSLLVLFCVSGLVICCRRRGDQTRLANVVYKAVTKGDSDSAPALPKKPPSGTVGPVNRNTKEKIRAWFGKKNQNTNVDSKNQNLEEPLVEVQG